MQGKNFKESYYLLYIDILENFKKVTQGLIDYNTSKVKDCESKSEEDEVFKRINFYYSELRKINKEMDYQKDKYYKVRG